MILLVVLSRRSYSKRIWHDIDIQAHTLLVLILVQVHVPRVLWKQVTAAMVVIPVVLRLLMLK
ncbi:MAG: hypothetical protein ACLUEQ_09850 [Cloacibacillus evryensis]